MPQPSSWHLDAALVLSLPFAIHSQRRVVSSMRAGSMAKANGAGDFDESEVWLFSAETLALVDALVEARLQGRYPEGDW